MMTPIERLADELNHAPRGDPRYEMKLWLDRFEARKAELIATAGMTAADAEEIAVRETRAAIRQVGFR